MCSDPVGVPHTCTTPFPQQGGGVELGCLCQESFHPSCPVILPGAPGVCLLWAGGTKAYSQISILSTWNPGEPEPALRYGFTLFHHRLRSFLERARNIIYNSLVENTTLLIFQVYTVACTVTEPLPPCLGSWLLGGSLLTVFSGTMVFMLVLWTGCCWILSGACPLDREQRASRLCPFAWLTTHVAAVLYIYYSWGKCVLCMF